MNVILKWMSVRSRMRKDRLRQETQQELNAIAIAYELYLASTLMGEDRNKLIKVDREASFGGKSRRVVVRMILKPLRRWAIIEAYDLETEGDTGIFKNNGVFKIRVHLTPLLPPRYSLATESR